MSTKHTISSDAKLDKKRKVFGTVAKKNSGLVVRENTGDGIYYSQKSGRVGYGRTYGENSYNGRPIDAVPGRAFEPRSNQAPFSPFDAPKPKQTGRRSSGVNVVKHDSHWAVRRDGAQRASRVFETQKEAIDYGRSIARRAGAELRIQDAQGRWREAESYGSDPFPPRDTKH